jgi:hypothetical protein
MLSLLPIVLALASADPAPSPSASAKPTPLTEIGRVRAIPVCTPIVVHANGAITTTLDNNRALAIMTTNLRNVDFDKLNEIQRRNAIDALDKQASQVRLNAKAADQEVKRLRELALASPDPARKAELKAFADAIGGAIYRQQKAAAEVMRDIVVMQGRADAQEARRIKDRDNPPPDAGGSSSLYQNRAAMPPPPARLNDAMRSIANDLDDRTSAIMADEGIAADHSIAATSGC